MKKKILAVALSFVLLASSVVPVYALDLGGIIGGDSSSEDTSDESNGSSSDGSISIDDILASDIMQEIMASEGVIDITNVVMEIILAYGSFDIKELGKEKALELIQNVINMVGGVIVDTKVNVEVFAPDPIKILDNLLGLNIGSLTTKPDDGNDSNDDELEFDLGDVDGDGRITAADARLILRRAARLITFTPEQDWLADVNGDGVVTAADARLVLRVAAKLDTFE